MRKKNFIAYCKENKLWGAKDDENGNGWRTFKEEPHKWKGNLFESWRVGDNTFGGGMEYVEDDDFIFPDCPWDHSLITPEGEMPLFKE